MPGCPLESEGQIPVPHPLRHDKVWTQLIPHSGTSVQSTSWVTRNAASFEGVLSRKGPAAGSPPLGPLHWLIPRQWKCPSRGVSSEAQRENDNAGPEHSGARAATCNAQMLLNGQRASGPPGAGAPKLARQVTPTAGAEG